MFHLLPCLGHSAFLLFFSHFLLLFGAFPFRCVIRIQSAELSKPSCLDSLSPYVVSHLFLQPLFFGMNVHTL